MRNNLELQIEQIDNKIQRLQIQKDFYQNILNVNERPEHKSIETKE